MGKAVHYKHPHPKKGICDMKRVLGLLAGILVVGFIGLWFLGSGLLGKHLVSTDPVNQEIPREVLAQRDANQQAAIAKAQQSPGRQILFGDFHVHSTISTDAFMMSLGLFGGDGARPVSDACDFARYCSSLDFWSINDHALAITPDRWEETRNAISACNAVSGNEQSPDMVSFLGWEWTQIGQTVESHYGHKNVILRSGDTSTAPERPISAGFPPDASPEAVPTLALGVLPFLLGFNSDTNNYITYMQELRKTPDCPADPGDMRCRDVARSPDKLFAKLDAWGGEAIVIPHGTTWGYYTPMGSSWDKQLKGDMHDPDRQTLVEVFSGHGNSEEYRSWREISWDAEGKAQCPPRTDNYLPSCQMAGDIIKQRCLATGADDDECDQRAAIARHNYVTGGAVEGFLTVPGATPEEWLDSGQCKDCYLPSFNYRPLSSVQYMMAISNFDEGEPRRFRFGFMAASDVHSARPGTGYKEFAREAMTESLFGNFVHNPLEQQPEIEADSNSVPFEVGSRGQAFATVKETERQASYFMTGGLMAVHADNRSRDGIWEAMERREVYGTSGPRILLWFDLLNAPAGKLAMGGETRMSKAPIFEVTAVGSLEQKPGCPSFSEAALGGDRIADLCRGECYNPSDTRRPITRIEVVRIQPQATPGEPVDDLIEDPWKVIPCSGDANGCTVSFSDPDFNQDQRDTLYYVRAIEAPSMAVNAGGVRCEYDEAGNCTKVNLCDISNPKDDCLAENEERAWSSPIFVDYNAL